MIVSNKLHPYFEAHVIQVRTNYPMKAIMSRPEFTGRMAKWTIHLSGFDIQYEPRTTIKSQALADFMPDFSPTLEQVAQKEICCYTEPFSSGTWQLHSDGASNVHGTSLGVVLKSP